MGGLFEQQITSGYSSEVPRRRTATIVLLLHILLLALLSRAGPGIPVAPETRAVPIQIEVTPLDPPAVPPPPTLPAQRSTPSDRDSRVEAPARRPGPTGPAPGPLSPVPTPLPQPAAGSPAP
ncbi:MAG TPA: hypothetical protein VF577_03670, partial [Allosphingosinicella sp.]